MDGTGTRMIYPDNYSPPQRRARDSRTVLLTCRGIHIGLRHQEPMPAPGVCAEQIQSLVLHRRPLAIDQLYVRMMCGEQ